MAKKKHAAIGQQQKGKDGRGMPQKGREKKQQRQRRRPVISRRSGQQGKHKDKGSFFQSLFHQKETARQQQGKEQAPPAEEHRSFMESLRGSRPPEETADAKGKAKAATEPEEKKQRGFFADLFAATKSPDEIAAPHKKGGEEKKEDRPAAAKQHPLPQPAAERKKEPKNLTATVVSLSDVNELENHLEEISKKGIARITTGVQGFDKLLTNGIPAGSAVLVEGGPGSGKTIFCLNVAYNLCKRGKKVLYMSFEEPERRLIEHMKGFGWTPLTFIRKGNLVIKRFSALDISRSVEALLSEAKRELLIEVKPMFFPRDYKPEVVLIDSLTSISSAFSGEPSRFRIYMEQLFKYLERENITSFLIRETPVPAHLGQLTGRESAVSFLADGIIAIYSVIHQRGERTRAMEIVKMRGEHFDERIVEMEITSHGIVVYADRTVPLGDVLA